MLKGNIYYMPNENDLLDRIRQLEMENSELRDKLDMIYAIIAPEEDLHDAEEDEPGEGLVQIGGVN